MTIDEICQRLTVSVPVAADALGISRAHAYKAVHNGTLPVIRFGKKMSVPTKALLRIVNDASVAPKSA
jgi:excisionase family DNA binding protein